MDRIEPDRRECRRSDDTLIAALVAAPTMADAAAQARVSTSTLKRRLADHEFTARLAAARAQVLRETVESLAGHASAAAATLREILDDRTASPAARVSAARELLDRAGIVRREQIEFVTEPEVDREVLQRFKRACDILERGITLADGSHIDAVGVLRRYSLSSEAAVEVLSHRLLNGTSGHR